MPADVPGHGTTANIRTRWLNLCGSCDAGLPAVCACPTTDPRGVIAALCDALDRAELRLDRLYTLIRLADSHLQAAAGTYRTPVDWATTTEDTDA